MYRGEGEKIGGSELVLSEFNHDGILVMVGHYPGKPMG